MLKRSC